MESEPATAEDVFQGHHPLSPPLSIPLKARSGQQRKRVTVSTSTSQVDDDADTTFTSSSFIDLINKTQQIRSQSLRPSESSRIPTPTSPASPEDGPSWDGSVRGLSASRRPTPTSLGILTSSGNQTLLSSPSSSSSSSRLPSILPSSARGRPSPPPRPTPLQLYSSSSSSKSSPSVFQLPKLSSRPTQPVQVPHRNAHASSSTATSRPRPRRRNPPLILSREEERALAARYDLMSTEELMASLAPWDPEREGELFGRRKRRSPTAAADEDAPLFPPSPPGSPGGGREHPIKILARIGWKLRSHQLEEDEEDGEEEEAERTPDEGHLQDATLHLDLFDALSTSLETSSSAFLSVPTLPRNLLASSSLPSSSRAPSSSLSLPLLTSSEPLSLNGSTRRDKARQGSVSTLSSFLSTGSASSAVSSSLPDGAPTPVVKSRASSLRNEAATGSLPMKKAGGRKLDKKRDRSGGGGSIGDWMWGWGGGGGMSSSSSFVGGSDPGTKDPQRKSLRGFLSPPLLSPAITTVDGSLSNAITSASSPLVPLFPSPAALGSFISLLPSTHDTIEPPPSLSEAPAASPSHFRALFLSTRVVSSTSSSLFSDPPSISPLVAQLAFELVTNARNANIAVKESSPRRVSSVGRTTKQQQAATATASPSKNAALDVPSLSSNSTSAKASRSREQPLVAASSVLSRVLNSATLAASSASMRSNRSRPAPLPVSARQPSPSADLGPGTARLAGASPFPGSGSSAGTAGGIPSVELESIEPVESKPPTLLFDRAGYLKGFFGAGQTGKGSTREKRASRFEKSGEALTDRYGFIYDVTSIKMLRDASEAGAPAPATFSGLNNNHSDDEDTDEEEDWVERNIQFIQASPKKLNGASLAVHHEVNESVSQDLRASLSSSSGVSVVSSELSGLPSDSSAPTSPTTDLKRGSRLRSATLSLNPSPVRPVISPQTFHVSADAPSLPTDASLAPGRGHGSNPISLTGRKTIQILLNQLTDIHDSQQSSRKTSWDAFLRRRRDSLVLSSSSNGGTGEDAGFVGFAQMGLGGRGVKEDYKEFVKLVREGVPISYRAKVWAECSGASDVMAPGEYEELLAKAEEEGVDSTVRNEIEKDVVRTLPLNVFFGGDGPGVAKLRKILTAFAWHDMSVGYCQGLNMVAATLLLTHQREEEAFWVFLCVVERLMPPNYYSPDLLCSRADQRVLQDFVQQELPALDRHLAEHGIEITAVAFGWFLSLFTDCLPVETLFRTWDVFFVEGFDTFFRIALAILKLNEKDLLEADSTSALYQHLGSCASRLWSADALLAVEHDLKATVTHDLIITRRAFHVSALVEEMGESRPY